MALDAASHGAVSPSPWVRRFAPLFAPGAPVLDLACGRGRHARWLAARGHPVLAVDRDRRALAALQEVPGVQTLAVDLEGSPWPFDAERRFAGIVVTNYLWRPRFSLLLAALDAGGVLIYETFALGQASIGKPSNPDFLLEPGELLARCAELRVVAYEDGFVCGPPAAFVQRICAVRPSARGGLEPQRYRLESSG